MSADPLHIRQTYPGRLIFLLGGAGYIWIAGTYSGLNDWSQWPFAILGFVVGAAWAIRAWRRPRGAKQLSWAGVLVGAILVVLASLPGVFRATGFAVSGFLVAAATLLPPKAFKTTTALAADRRERKNRRKEREP